MRFTSSLNWWRQILPRLLNQTSLLQTIMFNFSSINCWEVWNMSTLQEFITEIWNQETYLLTQIVILRFVILGWQELTSSNFKLSKLLLLTILQQDGTELQKLFFPGKNILQQSMFGQWVVFWLSSSLESHFYQQPPRKSNLTWSQSYLVIHLQNWLIK